ncbi:MFS transporter [Weissella paramesenteroides]|nr:MFS transporter [Weissella paramesenteroides]KAA8438756.1 MFS transporter [Weissella paramesenteroides]KAA8440772.1 MFS transporter [Weissella paramesenteroides]KAA8443203.1 MFS transporter [Weissella paramesenteroides]KAA8445389.1 MFS transporter [Weissella paramesenteroides]KAA8448820.1 MFS transporter [Weissella paramesenteroides]
MKGCVVHLKNKYILITNMLVNMGIGLIMPITTLYIHNVLHMSLVVAGYTLLLFSGAMALGNLIGGQLFDKWRSKPLMYISAIIIVIALFLLTLYPYWPIYPILLMLYGAGLGILNASINSYLAFLQKYDANIFNNGYWAANIGMGLATFLSGIFFSINIQLVFGSSALLFLLALFIIKSQFASIDALRSSGTENSFHKTLHMHTIGYISLLSLTMIIIWVCYEQWNSNVSVLMTNNGISVKKYSILFTIGTIEIVALQPFIVRLFPETFNGDKLRVILGVLTFALSYLLIINTNDYWRFVLGITFVSIGEILALTAIPSLLNHYANDTNRGTIQAIGSLSGSIGRALGPLLGGFMITSFSFDTTFLSIFIIHLILVVFLLLLRDFKPKY